MNYRVFSPFLWASIQLILIYTVPSGSHQLDIPGILAASKGNEVVLPTGSYYCTEEIQIQGPVKIIGVGKVTIKFSSKTYQDYFIKIINGSIYMKNIHWDGGYRVRTIMFGYSESKKNKVYIHNCHFSNAIQPDGVNDRNIAAGIRCNGAYDSIVITHSEINNITSNRQLRKSQGKYGPVTRGILIDRHGKYIPGTTIIRQCKIAHIETGGYKKKYDADGIFWRISKKWQKSNIIVQNCQFDNCWKRSIKLQGTNATIKGNYFTRSDPNIPPTRGGEISAQYGGANINNNTFFYPNKIKKILKIGTASHRTSRLPTSKIIKNNIIVKKNHSVDSFIELWEGSDQVIISDNDFTGTANNYISIRPIGLEKTIMCTVNILNNHISHIKNGELISIQQGSRETNKGYYFKFNIISNIIDIPVRVVSVPDKSSNRNNKIVINSQEKNIGIVQN